MPGTVVPHQPHRKVRRGIFNFSRVSLFREALPDRKLTAKSRTGIIPNVTPRMDRGKVKNALPWLPLPPGHGVSAL